jgi:hypothetical protein
MTFCAFSARPYALDRCVIETCREDGIFSHVPFTVRDTTIRDVGRGLHSSSFQLNLSCFSHRIYPEHPNTPEHPLNTP